MARLELPALSLSLSVQVLVLEVLGMEVVWDCVLVHEVEVEVFLELELEVCVDEVLQVVELDGFDEDFEVDVDKTFEVGDEEVFCVDELDAFDEVFDVGDDDLVGEVGLRDVQGAVLVIRSEVQVKSMSVCENVRVVVVVTVVRPPASSEVIVSVVLGVCITVSPKAQIATVWVSCLGSALSSSHGRCRRCGDCRCRRCGL